MVCDQERKENTMFPKISVIVPVYNVDLYLSRCLDSIINQTFSQIEIIIIDDGSSDDSGKICDGYAERDARIKLIHKPHEGLACARNDGVIASSAPFIMFVDSDDWVAPDFCEKAYEAAVCNNADVVVFQKYLVRNGCKRKETKKTPIGVVDFETAIKFGGCVTWNKIYRKELFQSILYPPGQIAEDMATTHKIMHAAKVIVILPYTLYYQVFRRESITHCRSVENKRVAFATAIQRTEELKGYGCDEETYNSKLLPCAMGLLLRAKPSDDLLYKRAEEIVDDLGHFSYELNWKQKIMFRIWNISSTLFHTLCRSLGQKER